MKTRLNCYQIRTFLKNSSTKIRIGEIEIVRLGHAQRRQLHQDQHDRSEPRPGHPAPGHLVQLQRLRYQQ